MKAIRFRHHSIWADLLQACQVIWNIRGMLRTCFKTIICKKHAVGITECIKTLSPGITKRVRSSAKPIMILSDQCSLNENGSENVTCHTVVFSNILEMMCSKRLNVGLQSHKENDLSKQSQHFTLKHCIFCKIDNGGMVISENLAASQNADKTVHTFTDKAFSWSTSIYSASLIVCARMYARAFQQECVKCRILNLSNHPLTQPCLLVINHTSVLYQAGITEGKKGMKEQTLWHLGSGWGSKGRGIWAGWAAPGLWVGDRASSSWSWRWRTGTSPCWTQS